MAEGFLGRWSQRKQVARSGLPVTEPVAIPKATPIVSPTAGDQSSQASPAAVSPTVDPPERATAAPSLEEAQRLSPDADFSRFVTRDVDPAVRNTAMKKLFTDPHFNVMDGLDIYIDDYSIPDPLPKSMLRKMASAQFLKLVEEDPPPAQRSSVSARESDTAAPPLADNDQSPPPNTPDQQQPCAAIARPESTQDHANPDLRLQQNHAAGPQSPGSGAE